MYSFLGIDPGKAGGIALIKNGLPPELYNMPETEQDIYALFDEIKQSCIHLTAIIEKVHGSPYSQGQFNFGYNYGLLNMALTAFQIPFDKVSPVKWQTALGCLSGSDKNITKAKAQQLFPQLKITHKTADALLLAEYLRRTTS